MAQKPTETKHRNQTQKPKYNTNLLFITIFVVAILFLAVALAGNRGSFVGGKFDRTVENLLAIWTIELNPDSNYPDLQQEINNYCEDEFGIPTGTFLSYRWQYNPANKWVYVASFTCP